MCHFETHTLTKEYQVKKAHTIAFAAAACTASAVSAQTELELLYSGRIIEIVDPTGHFDDASIGQLASGRFLLNLDADDIPDNPGGGVSNDPDVGLFEALEFDTAYGDRSFDSFLVFAAVFNNKFNSMGERFDAFEIDGTVDFSATEATSLKGVFEGNDQLFHDTGIDGASKLHLDNLDKAEVTIEFSEFDGPNAETSTVTIEVLNLTAGGNRVDLVCPADTNENGEIDFGDFSVWIDLFNNNDYRADINLDGEIDQTDFTAWLNAFNNGC